VVAIALGSTLAALFLPRRFAVRGHLVIGSLPGVSELVKVRPVLLFHEGKMQHAAMREARVTEGEILAALRSGGIASLREAGAVGLETDGSFSVIRELEPGGDSTLADVRGFPGRPST